MCAGIQTIGDSCKDSIGLCRCVGACILVMSLTLGFIQVLEIYDNYTSFYYNSGKSCKRVTNPARIVVPCKEG